MAQVYPSLASSVAVRSGALRASAIVGAVVLPILLTGVASVVLMRGALLRRSANTYDSYKPPSADAAARIVEQDFARLAAFLNAEQTAGRELPWDEDELYERWRAAHPAEPEPVDPYDGMWYGYEQRGEHFRLWSSGPRGERHGGWRYDSRARSLTQR
jgi:hypothetical protein